MLPRFFISEHKVREHARDIPIAVVPTRKARLRRLLKHLGSGCRRPWEYSPSDRMSRGSVSSTLCPRRRGLGRICPAGSVSDRHAGASTSKPTTQKPDDFNLSNARTRFVGRTSGTVSMAPDAALVSMPDVSGVCRSGQHGHRAERRCGSQDRADVPGVRHPVEGDDRVRSCCAATAAISSTEVIGSGDA